MDLASKKCVPCEVGGKPMALDDAQRLISQVNGWQMLPAAGSDFGGKGLKISKKFKFKDFVAAVDFVNKIADVAEAEGHHPDLEVGWGKVVVNLSTHAVGGLSENDFILAAKIDKLQQELERSEAK